MTSENQNRRRIVCKSPVQIHGNLILTIVTPLETHVIKLMAKLYNCKERVPWSTGAPHLSVVSI